MFNRLLLLARVAAWALTGTTIVYIATDAIGAAIPHEGAVWVLLGVSWTLVIDLKSHIAVRDQILAGVNKRMNDYEIHTLGHNVAAERTLGCRSGPAQS